MILLRTLNEGIIQAVQQLTSNKLRSFLSLLGISIGIFCIIGVFSAVDSMKNNIRESFERLGTDVLYVGNRPWTEDPDNNESKYKHYPNVSLEDYKALKEKLTSAELVSFSIYCGYKAVKYRSSNVNNAYVIGVSDDYSKIFNIEYQFGRFFSPIEYNTGSDKIVLGYEVSKALFGEDIDPIGREIGVFGRKYQIIGVIKKMGNSLIDIVNFDECCIISINNARKFINVKEAAENSGGLSTKPFPNVDSTAFKGDLISLLRAERKINPISENNFFINEISLLGNILDQVFKVINLAGFSIGFFSLLVGLFSVANIMFVSVKERTNIIGIKKALGATRNVILLEFLIESVILCIIGGLVGLGFVYLVMKILSAVLDFSMYLSFSNVVIGVGLSCVIGILSGIIPSYIAAKMPPVEAIRQ